MRNGVWLPILLLGAFLGFVIGAWAVIGFHLSPGPSEGAGSMTYADLSALMLGAVAVLVTVLGIFLAVLAIWGYAHLRDAARAAALEEIKRELADEGTLRERLERLVVGHVGAELQKPDGTLRKLVSERVDLMLLKDAETRDREHGGDNLANEDDEYGG